MEIAELIKKVSMGAGGFVSLRIGGFLGVPEYSWMVYFMENLTKMDDWGYP